jgi:hypothetical protein
MMERWYPKLREKCKLGEQRKGRVGAVIVGEDELEFVAIR